MAKEKIIYKFRILSESTVIQLPMDHKYLACDSQEGYEVMWFLMEKPTSGMPMIEREFITYKTGEIILYDIKQKYIGTVMSKKIGHVTHIFELIK